MSKFLVFTERLGKLKAPGTLHLARPQETEAEADALKTVFIGSLEIRVSYNCTEGPQLPRAALPYPLPPHGHGKSSFLWAQRLLWDSQ